MANPFLRTPSAPEPPKLITPVTRGRLLEWLSLSGRGSRPQSDKEKLFTDWARLPYDQRQEVQLELATQFICAKPA